MIEEKVKKHDCRPHGCDKFLICKLLAERGQHGIADLDDHEIINILFEAL
jgi:hypothetical protein